MPEHSSAPDRRSPELNELIENSAAARRARAVRGHVGGGSEYANEKAGPSARAAGMLDELLSQPMPPVIDVGSYFTRVASLQLMASSKLEILKSRVQKLRMASRRARALATALCELVHFVESGVPPHGAARMLLVVARDAGRLVIGLSVQGDYSFVAKASGSASLMRAMKIVEALNGDFGRGFNEDGMAFGILLPSRRRGGGNGRYR